MKALLYRQSGGPEVLEYIDVADPEAGPGDVVIEVAATALNHLDVVQRNGWYHLPGFTFPHIAGMDVVGTVVEIGAEVSLVARGDRVVVDPSLAGVGERSSLAGMGDIYGVLGVIGGTVAGGYAERCLAPETHVHRIPDDIGWHEAVAFPSAWMTAHHALFATGGLQRGETVMIHAAGSGVSTAAIQLAKRAGATVLATAGTEAKCRRAAAIGADHAVVNRDADVAGWARDATRGEGVDMVFDHVGPALWEQSLLSLKPRGRLVNCGNTTGDSVTIPSLGMLFHLGLQIRGSDAYRPEEFAPVWDLYCSGGFHAPIDSVSSLQDGAAAQAKMLTSDFFGKIVLEP